MTEIRLDIRLNGQSHRISANLTLAQLLSELAVNPQKVAVAKNLEVIPRSLHDKTHLESGDEIEIFQAVGGG